LHAATTGKEKIVWSENCEQAFNKLRTILTSEKILALPDFTKEFKLETDESNYGVGAVLSQTIDDKERQDAYFSKPLTKTQQNYSTPEKELLAIVQATEHFIQYLIGREFEVVTDHQPLKWLMSCAQPAEIGEMDYTTK
jgi:hypothetical protein